MEVKDVTIGYSERISRIALFEPLYELERKKQVDANGAPIDMKGLGLLTLLFFFEQKLMRNQRAGVKELATFLLKVTEGTLKLDLETSEEMARTIIQSFRPATGKKRDVTFFNWDSKQQETIYFSILKANSFDVKTNSQYYTLDEDGLELVFATKEFYSEFQLSINQLVLRKQLEKGEFKGALRQINEMRIDVESLEERMVKLEHEIKRNIISEDTYTRYQTLLEDIYLRLNLENEEFEALHRFVKETKERLYYKDNTSKERETYSLVLEISKELEGVHAGHTSLLQKSIDLKNTALKSAQESLYYVGIDSFNFEQDLTARLISSPLPLQSMKGLLAPFLNIQESKQWSLLTVYADQNITEEREATQNHGFLEYGEEDSKRYLEIVGLQYRRFMELLLQAMDGEETLSLLHYLEYLRQNEYEYMLESRYIYDFFMLIHQRSPIQKDSSDDEEHTHLLDGVKYLLGNQIMIVEENPGVIQVTKRYSIQNMTITIGAISE
ncbi:replicative DNA helicase [Bacillus sp. DJP31]|uniref:replicative DNA helicase n=1 Tax=Bacillus sp. DJP31 TaxID=3409789 RepID=UPI003BB4ED6D